MECPSAEQQLSSYDWLSLQNYLAQTLAYSEVDAVTVTQLLQLLLTFYSAAASNDVCLVTDILGKLNANRRLCFIQEWLIYTYADSEAPAQPDKNVLTAALASLETDKKVELLLCPLSYKRSVFSLDIQLIFSIVSHWYHDSIFHVFGLNEMW